MKIQFVKNIQFTKLVKVDGQLREFNFRKINGVKEGLFTVDVNDERGNRKMFNMQKEDTAWKIALPAQLPTWISSNEQIFDELIEEELRKV